ncbi:dihydrolipoyl dehydrogenase [Anaerobaca lacustris]|uniref:Dihydrolipoyl dehydrogenase n=1 Tax=Anaerobaca lacustris TaxID=3044600 RepID=A0AAW6U3T1_9BACT|nr:dihydrolipoyl dehydrogenase [Sedimentisphaerales bacterium M17dextr]
MADTFDVVVVGAGPGGARAARRCAQRGASVALVEKEFIGGTCLNWGCIPSKTLLASAHLLMRARSASEMGIDIPSATPNWPRIQQRRESIIAGLRKGMQGGMKSGRIAYLEGTAVVHSPTKVTVEANGQKTDLEAGKLILATGSDSIEIPSIPFDGKIVISSTEALSLLEIPKSMVIVGGGVIGCELGCVYAAMGAKVTIVEALESLLPMLDSWASRLVEREFKGLGIEALTGRKVTGVDKGASSAKVNLDDGQTIEAERVLVAVGRRAAVDRAIVSALGLEMSGPAIKVNKRMETNVPGVYAVGDAVGTTYLAHGATAEAEVAAANATGSSEEMLDYDLIPRVIFTFPEVASVGKTEAKCLAEGLDISVGKGFYKANGRSVAENDTNGQIHAIRDNAINEIVGVTMVGPLATEFVAFARTLIGTCEPIRQITFPHPTISETLEDAVHEALGELLLE